MYCISASSQNVGIGTITPKARLHVVDSSVVFSATGDVNLPAGDPPISGAGRRMMWYADKAAFRVGMVNGSQWDNANIGIASFATGIGTYANGDGSAAFGANNIAIGNYSFAAGRSAMAAGEGSIAIGRSSQAKGNYSSAFGFSTVVNSYAGTVIGIYNDIDISANSSNIRTSDLGGI